MSHTTRNLKQTITYWAPSVGSDAFGQKMFNAPVTMRGFWEDKQQVVRNQQGTEIASQAQVFLAADVETGGYLIVGEVTTLEPTTVEGAIEIKAFSKIPDLRQANHERRAFL